MVKCKTIFKTQKENVYKDFGVIVMRKRLRQIIILGCMAAVFMGGGMYGACFDNEAERNCLREELSLYGQYFRTVDFSETMNNYEGEGLEIFSNIRCIEAADVNLDGCPEIILHGPGASAAEWIWIFDIVDGKAQCVFADWGSIIGHYENSDLEDSGVLVLQGNGNDVEYDMKYVIYDEDWNSKILAGSYLEYGGEENFYYNSESVSSDQYRVYTEQLQGKCTEIPVVYKSTDLNIEWESVADILENTFSGNESENEYIIQDSNTRYLSMEEIQAMSLKDLCYARNEIYARRGRKFQSVELQRYFNTKSWYRGEYEPEQFPYDSLNEIETYNVNLLYECEHNRSAEGYVLDSFNNTPVVQGADTVYKTYANLLGQGVTLEYGTNGEWFPAQYFYLLDMNQDGIEELLAYGMNEWHEFHWKLFTYENGLAVQIAQSDSNKPGNAGHSLQVLGGCCIKDSSDKHLVGYMAEWDTYVYMSDGEINTLKEYYYQNFTDNEMIDSFKKDDMEISEQEFYEYLSQINTDGEIFLSEYEDGDGLEINETNIVELSAR